MDGRSDGNELEVHIFSPELHARRYRYDAFQYSRGSAAHRQAQAYLRKARHMWGWDNAPHLLSAGVWRDVVLVVRKAVRFEDVYLNTQVIGENQVTAGCGWSISTPDADLSRYDGVIRFKDDETVVHEDAFPVNFVAGRFTTNLPRSPSTSSAGTASSLRSSIRGAESGERPASSGGRSRICFR